jgi:hypothetical protein
MGLDAAVYKRLDELPFTGDELCFITVDPRTGEIDFEGNQLLFQTWHEKVRLAKRIGNIAFVDLLRAELEKILGSSNLRSLLIDRVLYDGTHSGDIIPKEDLPPLRREIALIRGLAGDRASSELESFLADIEELAAASEKNGNPIVFV